MDNRREFYRIDDVISLNYKVVQEDDAGQEKQQQQIGDKEGKASVG